jgi:hypothetical protein
MQVCELFSTLIVHARQNDQSMTQASGLENEYQILLRKYLRSTELQTCRIGVVGTISLIERMVAASQDNFVNEEGNSLDKATELIQHAIQACKTQARQHSAIVFSLLCDELTCVVSKASKLF